MITEEQLKDSLAKAKNELDDLLKSVQLKINACDWDGAVENCTCLSANLTALIVAEHFLKFEEDD